ncbi:hypothetical protein KKC60_00605, partial [Patescibacteria group bacterium]|nr:hypothetical protein [Patescibacteria group bacterium]
MKTIYLDIDEEITSAIDKIKQTKVYDLVLVIPKRAVLIQSIVNLQLLKRQSDIIGKNVLVVTSDKVGYNLAKRAGLEVRTEIPSSDEIISPPKSERMEKKRIHRPVESVAKEEDDKVLLPPTESFEMFPKREENLKLEEKESNQGIEAEEESEEFDNKAVQVNTYHKKESKEDTFRPQLEDTEIEGEKDKKKRRIVFLPKVSIKFFILFCGISLAIAGLIFFVLLPKAEITVYPKTEQYVSSLDVVIEKDIPGVDYENNLLPGEIVFAEGASNKQEFKTAGVQEIGDKSKGEVIIYNKFSSSTQPLVANTRFQADNGKTYRIPNNIEVPGATIEGGSAIPGRIKVVLEADEAGKEYDIEGSRFIIPGLPAGKQEAIWAESVGPMTGGDKRTVRILSEEDLEKAKNELAEPIYAQALENLKSKVPADKSFFDSAVKKEIIETKSSKEVGAETEDFTLEVKVRVSTLIFNESDMEMVIKGVVEAAENEEKEVLTDGIQEGVEAELLNFDFESGKMGLKVKIEKTLAYRIDL